MMKVIVGTPPPQDVLKKIVWPASSSPRELAGDPRTFSEKHPGAEEKNIVEDLEWEKVSLEEVLSIASTSSLMGDTRTIRFSGALTGERGEEFLSILEDLQHSPHQFIFQEEKLLKKPTDKLAKAGVEVVVFAAKKDVEEGKEKFDIFSLTYAFAARDKKKTWLLLEEALRHDVAPEAVAGILHWKVRDTLAKGGAQKYTKQELRRISRDLVSLYHDSHRGAGDLGLLLEKFVLTL